ncbi:ABC transporter permease [Mycoplasmopsis mucosicanis]|uniref:ABC transporter permease n=1 Tax=Mycoplasmopsis mucosicanis TaxID=458208 RepID=A0A507SII5_9BACT|nr:ABC transporter permease [Mycoplasmopsis mucosicanis]TQC51530.1 ABC transporter permease [Mycoplasmopsis mucosicanis]
MWRLFKEVFKSLSKNKVVVIGLSILVFLTSAIFTLLSSVKNVIVGGFENYKHVSKLHDVSVDLNLPTQGNAYNQGYFINGETSETLKQKGKSSYEPIIYHIDDSTFDRYKELAKEYSHSVNIELSNSQTPEYIQLSNLSSDFEDNLKNKYIKSENLFDFYNIAKNETNIGAKHKSVDFDLSNINNPFFKLYNSKEVQLFEKNNTDFTEFKQQIELKTTDNASFDNDSRLGDILLLSRDNNEIYASQLSPLYVNVQTIEITHDYTKSLQWSDEGVLFTIEPKIIASVLGFEAADSSRRVQSKTKANTSATIYKLNPYLKSNLDVLFDLPSADAKIDENLKFKRNIPLNLFLLDNQKVSKPFYLTLDVNKKYKLNQEWLIQNEVSTNFLRNHYYTSFINESKNKWSGAFKTYIESLGDPRLKTRDKQWDQLETFAYWRKQKSISQTPFIFDQNTRKWVLNTNKKVLNTFELPLSSTLDFAEINKLKLWSDDKRISPLKTPYEISKRRPKTINEIEVDNLFGSAKENYLKAKNNQKIDILRDENQLNFNYSLINSKAFEATKQLIVDKVIKKVGESNVGIRQSITVNGIDEKTGKQNTYHFINTGDKDFKISGIKLNVGALFNESQRPSLLSKDELNNEDFYKSSKINPYVSALLIQSIFKNLYPDKNYISPKFEFASVIDSNPKNREYRELKNTKIVLLTDYNTQKNDSQNNKKNVQEIYGIIGVANKFKFVQRRQTTDESANFEVIYTTNMPSDGMDIGLLTKFLNHHKLTIATDFIKTDGDGWVIHDSEFKNISYIPIYFLAPKTQLINDVLKNGKIDVLADTIEKFLLNSDFIKKEFLTTEQILELSRIIKVVLNKHNFASVFTNGKINNGILPELIIDFIYELSHSRQGDLIKILISQFLNQSLNQISSSSDLSVQKYELLKEVKKIFATLKTISGIDLEQYINAKGVVNASKDPKIVIASLNKVVASIDFKRFSEQARNWFEKENNKEFTHKGTKFIKKLSSGTIINWVFSSIDQKTLKDGLSDLINNLDFTYLLDLNNKDSLLYYFLNKNAPQLIIPLERIIKKINANEPNLEPYSNAKTGIINIIKSIDFNVLKNELNKRTTTEFIDFEDKYFDSEANKEVLKKHNVALERISPRNGIVALLKSIFSVSGSNREFKENIIKIFNLSSKTDKIDVPGSNSSVYLPANDNDKVSFNDFVSIFGSLVQTKDSSIFRNFVYENELTKILNVLTKSKLDAVNFSAFDSSTVKFIIDFNILQQNENTQKAVLKVKNLLNFIAQTKGGTNVFLSQKDKTGSDILADLTRFENGTPAWQLVKKLLESAAGIQIDNEYALGAQSFDIFKPLIQIYLNPEANYEQANKFVRDILRLSIDPEVLKLSTRKAESKNIPFTTLTDFYITDWLLNIDNTEFFDFDQNTRFSNVLVENLAKQNPQYRNWIAKNKLLLKKQFAYIGASKKFSSNTSLQKNGVYHYALETFVNNYLSSKEFYDVKDTASILVSKLTPSVPVKILGIPDVLVNPVLRFTFPELTLSYLAIERQEAGLTNGNLAYLVLDKIVDFEELIDESSDKFKELVNLLDASFAQKDTTLVPLNLDKFSNLVLDKPALDNLNSKTQNEISIFGLNITKILPQLINEIVEPKPLKEIVFNSSSSFVAKANYAFLINNDKEIYNGEIPSNPLEINDFINNLDSKYTLDVNGVKFVIVGHDTTVDYLYPVLDENNLQVNTHNQALVYVNKAGFDRIKLAYAGNVVKESLLVKNSTSLKNTQLKAELTQIVEDSIADSNKLQRVFLTNEIDPINPERALRVSTVESIIRAISVASTALLITFTFVVGISIVFIIKRYISNKNKVLGILVAQGYSPSRIALSLTIFAAVTSVLGGILGYAVGNRLQLSLLNVFSSYWTLPKETVSFDWLTMLFTVFIPFIGMSLLIYVVALISLRFKPTELMSGSVSIPKSKLAVNYHKLVPKSNVKKRFSMVLTIANFWKLLAFSTSALLTSTATIFGLASNNIFTKTINNTYKNRHYSFKIDLDTPSTEGGPYTTYNPKNLENNLYTPIGESIEAQRELYDYFKPGFSRAINKNNKNGTPNQYDSHILTQFSASIKVDSGVAADPWLIAYNSMPDTQKAKIDKIRDKVGVLLEKTQSSNLKKWVVDKQTNNISLQQNNENTDFFKYYKSPFDKQGRFVLAKWSKETDEYIQVPITTEDSIRSRYREFLVQGYKKLQERIEQEEQNPQIIEKNPNNSEPEYGKLNYWLNDPGKVYGPTINDYFISFGGVYFDPRHDEKYTYIKTTINNKDLKIYGYQQNSRFVKLGSPENNLYDKLYKFNKEGINPLIINEVSARKNNLAVGSVINVNIENHIDRFKDKLNAKINKTAIPTHNAIFEVIAINDTFIGEEFITRIDVANKLIGLDKFGNGDFFNGILTDNKNPLQVTNSTGLYSSSGYWAGIDSYNLDTVSIETLKSMFDQIFDPINGLSAKTNKLNANQIIKFLSPQSNTFSQDVYNSLKDQPKEGITNFANIYNNKLYVALANSIDSKDIESGFTTQIGFTVQTIVVVIIALSFSISLIILIMISTIMIAENSKNIAIWTILGYRNREKLRIYFSVYLPFIVLAILLSIPLTMLIISLFNAALLVLTGVALQLSLNIFHALITLTIMLGIFITTSFITWVTVNKVRPVDLLKGK